MVMTPTSTVVGRRIRLARERLSLSQTELGAAIGGVSTSSISAWERGITNLGLDDLEKLARALGVSLPWFLGDDGTTEPRDLRDLVRLHFGDGPDVALVVHQLDFLFSGRAKRARNRGSSSDSTVSEYWPDGELVAV